MSELVHVLDGQVVLYTRARTKRWQARLRLAAGWLRISTGAADLEKAKAAALKRYYQIQAKCELNLPERTLRFGADLTGEPRRGALSESTLQPLPLTWQGMIHSGGGGKLNGNLDHPARRPRRTRGCRAALRC